MISTIENYFENQDSVFITVATVQTLDGDVALVLAPEYSIEEGDEIFVEDGEVYDVLNAAAFSKDETALKMICDLNKGANVLIAKGKINRKEF